LIIYHSLTMSIWVPGNHSSNLIAMKVTVLYSTYKWDHVIFVFLCLPYSLYTMTSSDIHARPNEKNASVLLTNFISLYVYPHYPSMIHEWIPHDFIACLFLIMCNEHAGVSLRYKFHALWIYSRGWIVRSHYSSMTESQGHGPWLGSSVGFLRFLPSTFLPYKWGFFSFIRMCIQCLCDFSPVPPIPFFTAHHSLPLSPQPPHNKAESILPLSLILLTREYKQ
jgi:hypothetical protein